MLSKSLDWAYIYTLDGEHARVAAFWSARPVNNVLWQHVSAWAITL
jgi:hypothetical protein